MEIGNMIAVIAICFVPLMVIFAMMPYIGRRTLTFGVSIPSDQYDIDELKRMRSTFARRVVLLGLLTIIAAVAVFAYTAAHTAVSLTTALVFVYIIGIFALYVRRNKAAKLLKSEKGWQDSAQETVIADTRFASSKRSVSSLWFVLYVVIVAATLLIGILLYDQIPDKVPMQTDFDGTVTRIADKSYGLILFAPALQAFITVLFGFIFWMMQRTPPVIDPERPEESSIQNTRFRYRWSAFIVFGGMAMLLIFLGMQLGFAQVLSRDLAIYIPLGAAGAMIIAAIALSISTGQSGSRIRVGQATDGSVIRRDDDQYWKWGSVYVNKDDPALFVEKRFGVGFTLNFGQPKAIAILIGFVVLIAAIAILSSVLSS